MAKKADARTFNVGVIGLSGTEREKGQYGVGKSCLCNRFIHQVQDKYHTEHISVLSQCDFAGRVINNDHFLYWGEAIKTDDGNNYTFHVVEQTEFIDDVSFQPFKTGRTDPYIKRCVAVKVQSAEKLMYICKDQLGMETDSSYEQKLMPEGRLNIDGFLCCFDVSQVSQRSSEKQCEFVASLLLAALKTKKPVVLVATKQDEADDQLVRDLERLLTRREFKGTVPLVETSAHENVNVEAAFMLLAYLIDRSKPRFKILPYVDAARQRREICQVATEAYRHLLRSQISDPRTVWTAARRRLQSEQDFGHYIDLFGTEQARNEFRRHTKLLRDEQVRLREHHYLQQLPRLLRHYLPSLDVVGERSWVTVQRSMQTHPDFSSHFVEVCQPGESWKTTEEFLDNNEEKRIPFDLLNSQEAENCFRNHLSELQARRRKKELQQQFKQLLEENPQVTVGRPLSETYVFLVGKECYTGLDESERAAVYEDHQQELRIRARHAFHEMLWEHSELFWSLSATQRLTREDLNAINQALQNDNRYRILARMEEERKVMILNHLGFLQCPSRDRCYYRDSCVDNQLVQLLADHSARCASQDSSPVRESSVGESALNLVLLGKDGLAITLNHEIRVCVLLDYRPIDGDVTREQNALATANFKPHGCICVYNSEETLEYLHTSLEQWLSSPAEREEWLIQGFPIIFLHAHHPNLSHKQQEILHEQGQQLAHRMHAEFIDAAGEDWEAERVVGYEDASGEEDTEQLPFHENQIQEALQTIICRASNTSQGWSLDALHPPIRICMCVMCGDPFPLEVPLGPLLNSEGLRVGPENPYAVTLQAYLESHRQQVEVEVTSYHGRPPVPERTILHGYILVYSAQRRASLATLRAFAAHLPAVPRLIVAVADSGGAAQLFFNNEVSQALIREGNQLADELGAVFMTTTANFRLQTAAYLPFFLDVLELREQSEAACMAPLEEPCPPAYEDDRLQYMDRRPPAPLPKYYDMYQTAKSSTSNSQSTDSEPVYDQPNLYQSHYSDSEHERASSASPPASDEIYSEVQLQDEAGSEYLVRPSFVRTQRNVYKDGRVAEPVNSQGGDGTWTRNQAYGGAQNKTSSSSLSPHSNLYHVHHPYPARHSQAGMLSHYGPAASNSQVTAPLAIPEPIEIADYSLVKDAVACEEPDNDYALVDDALPPGQLHRIRSTKSPLRYATKAHTDSEDSEFSSLERNHNTPSTKTKKGQRQIPHRKKSKHRVQYVPDSHSASSFQPRGNSAHKHKDAAPEGGDGLYESVMHFQTLPRYGPASTEEKEYDLNDSDHWSSRLLGFKTLRADPEKQRRKDERRRQKEEDKKLKETQKRKNKKKDCKVLGPQQGGCCLEDFPSSVDYPLVPLFVEKCITYIENEGMNTEGIYRIPGNRAQGDLFVAKFNEDPQVDIASLEIPVNAVATVLKSFFNELSEPLVPRFLHEELMEAAGVPDKSSRLLMLRGVVKKLPDQNFEVLKYLICHLRR
ncbi:hypothetical protein BaRGS_00017253 [Batillaria attramentaria]|uniref:Rho GTPase-activating protein 190 n=1 Tax=Batillaria attramentaria TaxID=370345 RepID=A0ABD0KWZ4_9CAEN